MAKVDIASTEIDVNIYLTCLNFSPNFFFDEVDDGILLHLNNNDFFKLIFFTSES